MTRTASGPTPDAHRLFFAVWPDPAVREALEAAVDSTGSLEGPGRRVAASKFHITLHFLGGWHTFPDGVAQAARAAAATVEASPFHLVIDHAGGFARSRVGWLAPSGNSGLDALWSALGHALDHAGVQHRASETFSPHVTVLRGVREPIPETPITPLSWPVDRFVLVHSHTGRYDVIGEWTLPAG